MKQTLDERRISKATNYFRLDSYIGELDLEAASFQERDSASPFS
jgi:hypothetical protein